MDSMILVEFEAQIEQRYQVMFLSCELCFECSNNLNSEVNFTITGKFRIAVSLFPASLSRICKSDSLFIGKIYKSLQ